MTDRIRPDIAFHDLRENNTYRMALDGGRRFSKGDRVRIISKIPGSQFSGSEILAVHLNGTKHGMIRVSGASWFTHDHLPDLTESGRDGEL